MFTLRKIESSQELSSGFDSDEETIVHGGSHGFGGEGHGVPHVMLRGQDDDLNHTASPKKT